VEPNTVDECRENTARHARLIVSSSGLDTPGAAALCLRQCAGWVTDWRPPTVRPLWDVGGSRPAARSADGFRLDLASVLSGRPSGEPMPNPPVLWDIESDPVLTGTKLIAEAWDAAGLYQVGSFVGDSWQEWNGRAPGGRSVHHRRQSMKPLQARPKPCVRLSGGDELSEVAGGQGGQIRPAVGHDSARGIATTVTTLEAQGEVATLTLKRGWGRIAGRDANGERESCVGSSVIRMITITALFHPARHWRRRHSRRLGSDSLGRS
jgi:hypothetical protein